ncbi:MAG: VTT domain-containing protein [Clostridia bacterium]|nr:VTT domain-containing protein [Clostridia bacterium]
MSNRYKQYSKKKRIVTVALLILSVGIIALVTYLVGKPLMEFASEPESFRDWVSSHGIWGKVFLVSVNALQIILAFIPGEPIEVAAGYAFGAFEGTVLCLIASAVGGTIVFWLVKLLGRRLVNIFFEEEKLENLKFLKKSPARDLLFFTIFLIPGTPKDLLCYAAGLSDVKFHVWLLICTIGRIPSIITSTISGNALGTQRYTFATIAFVVTLVLSLLGLLLYRHITRKASANTGSDTATDDAAHENTVASPGNTAASEPASGNTAASEPAPGNTASAPVNVASGNAAASEPAPGNVDAEDPANEQQHETHQNVLK